MEIYMASNRLFELLKNNDNVIASDNATKELIPKQYEGYNVIVEITEKFTAHSN